MIQFVNRELQNGKMFGGKGLGDGKCFARGVERQHYGLALGG